MYLQNVTLSSIPNGTSSSGASPTNYETPWWKGIEHKEAVEILFFSLAANKTTGIDPYGRYLFPKINLTTANVVPDYSQRKITQYWQSEKLPTIRKSISKQFAAIRQRKDNWDDCGSDKPNRLSISGAEGIIEDLLNAVIEFGYLWLAPFISNDEDGNITIEWHKGQRELHIDVNEDEAEYIKVWGTNIESEMHVDFLDRDNYVTLWEWLLHG